MSVYERHVLAPLTACICAGKAFALQRARIVPQACGVVADIGFGSGTNLPHYNAAHVSRVIGIEPSAAMLNRAKANVARSPFPVDLVRASGEGLPLAGKSVDTCVFTYALCTIPDPGAALQEARRILKPDGCILFCEHGRAQDEGVARWQDRLDGLWGTLAGGCHLNRDPAARLTANGFVIEALETYTLPRRPALFAFHYVGRARLGEHR
ncbi:MAG: class I SAM-dependent methyltransferase [Pseudomonadota bacterium]